jgi:hypothetical protein
MESSQHAEELFESQEEVATQPLEDSSSSLPDFITDNQRPCSWSCVEAINFNLSVPCKYFFESKSEYFFFNNLIYFYNFQKIKINSLLKKLALRFVIVFLS